MTREKGAKMEGHPSLEEYVKGSDGQGKRWDRCVQFDLDGVSGRCVILYR